MRFDPFKWHEVKPNEEISIPRGMLSVMCSKEAAFFVTVQGYEVLAGTGKKLSLKTDGEGTFRVEAPKETRVFYENPQPLNIRPTGEKYTNLDRRPEESGAVLAVRQEVRNFLLAEQQKRKLLLAKERERRALKKARETTQHETAPETNATDDGVADPGTS